MHHQSGFLPELTAKIQIIFVKWLPIIKKMVKKKEEETKKHGICRFLCNFAGNIIIASAMDKEKEVLTRNTDSDYERLKVWKDNPKLDDYLSEKHWNHQVNELLYAYLKSRYSGNEVGVYINMGLLSYQEGQDYNQIYGVMFNEAYCFCSYVLTTPVPYTKIAFLERKAKTLCSIESAAPLISYNILVMTGLILCFANDHNDDVGRFLNYLSIHNSTHCFSDKFHHFEDYCKIGLICVAGIMADGQLQPPGKLRPGYDYKSRDEYLRKTIIEYKCIAEEMEKNRKETNTRKQEEKMAMDDKFNDILNKLAEQTEIIRRIEHHSNVAHHQQRRSDSWESIMRYVDFSSLSKQAGEGTEKAKRLVETNTIFKIPVKYQKEPERYLLIMFNFIKSFFIGGPNDGYEIKNKYEWYALRRFLDKYKLISDCDNETFAKQMNHMEWFGYLKTELQCAANEMNTYNYLKDTHPTQWIVKDIPVGSRATGKSVRKILNTYNNLELYKEKVIGCR